ncbi:hypothetical protein [Nocardiopsis trehalosi]|jgi:hypothetical protein|nr:hypothetical protein [Nocardiopsis trehalosi]
MDLDTRSTERTTCRSTRVCVVGMTFWSIIVVLSVFSLFLL